MISRKEIATQAQRFGAPDTQVVRDHLISHVIEALSRAHEDVTFFGGTALCRTWLPDLRLSEDVDLLVDNHAIGETLTKELTRRLRRQFPEHECCDSQLRGHLRADGRCWHQRRSGEETAC